MIIAAADADTSMSLVHSHSYVSAPCIHPLRRDMSTAPGTRCRSSATSLHIPSPRPASAAKGQHLKRSVYTCTVRIVYGTPRPTRGLRTLRVDIIRKASSMNGRAARRTFNVPTETPRPNSASTPPRRVDLLSCVLWEQRAFDSHHTAHTGTGEQAQRDRGGVKTRSGYTYAGYHSPVLTAHTCATTSTSSTFNAGVHTCTARIMNGTPRPRVQLVR
ncbi:hypothetical protein B0H13DRAFT_2310306 [Mycena leptocephala]|nr:hypothetical protein B0H13DRAFT_2310306 [Mycena leptocephala]